MSSSIEMEDLFACWDSIADMASDVGVSTWRASKWRQRKRIPPEHWAAVLSALSRKGKDVGSDDLVRMHSKPVSTAPNHVTS
jgi:hypothetical protein